MDNPYILDETEDYAVVFKPAKMHSETLPKDFTQRHKGIENTREFNVDTTLSDWFKSRNGSNKMINLMHRLDYETHGLVLFAKNEKSFLFFKSAQDNGEFIKEYSAICVPADRNKTGDGFPEKPSAFPRIEGSMPPRLCVSESKVPFIIESYFRPFGPGRKLVRPVIEDGKKHKEFAKDKDGFYRTEIIDIENDIFKIRIKRGFRHQIRCHLSWIGCPILNDPLYSTDNEPPVSESIMALRSHAIFFPDPKSENQLEYKIEGLV